MIYKLYLIRSIEGFAEGPIARPSLSRGPVGHLKKVLCSCHRGRCSWPSESRLTELCPRQPQKGRWGSGRTERQLGPCFLKLQRRLAAGPCTYECRYGEKQRDVTTPAQERSCVLISGVTDNRLVSKLSVLLLFFCSSLAINMSETVCYSHPGAG